jgi:hypothetical protein
LYEHHGKHLLDEHLKVTLIDEECPINVEAKTLELNLTQSLKCEEEPAMKVMCPKVD